MQKGWAAEAHAAAAAPGLLTKMHDTKHGMIMQQRRRVTLCAERGKMISEYKSYAKITATATNVKWHGKTGNMLAALCESESTSLTSLLGTVTVTDRDAQYQKLIVQSKEIKTSTRNILF